MSKELDELVKALEEAQLCRGCKAYDIGQFNTFSGCILNCEVFKRRMALLAKHKVHEPTLQGDSE